MRMTLLVGTVLAVSLCSASTTSTHAAPTNKSQLSLLQQTVDGQSIQINKLEFGLQTVTDKVNFASSDITTLNTKVNVLQSSQSQLLEIPQLRLSVQGIESTLLTLGIVNASQSESINALNAGFSLLTTKLDSVSQTVSLLKTDLAQTNKNVSEMSAQYSPVIKDSTGKQIGVLISDSNDRSQNIKMYVPADKAYYDINADTGSLSGASSTVVWFAGTECTGQAYTPFGGFTVITGDTTTRFFKPLPGKTSSQLFPVNSRLVGTCVNTSTLMNDVWKATEIFPTVKFPLNGPLSID